MNKLRTLAFAAAGAAFALVALSPIVRITDSGLGCGDDWPLCNGRLIPPLNNPEVMIEWGHRLAVVAVSVLIITLLLASFALRRVPGVGGSGGVLRAAAGATVLLAVQVLLGAITVWNHLPWMVTAIHLANAMALLAVLCLAAFRTTNIAAVLQETFRGRVVRSTYAAVGLTAAALVLGAITANIGAGPACQGFPLCSGQLWPSAASGLPHIHWTHRLIAYVLFLHLFALGVSFHLRRLPRSIRVATWTAFGLTVVQVIVAAAMVFANLPPALRSLHVIIGTGVWVSVVYLVWLVTRQRAAAVGQQVLEDTARRTETVAT